MHAVPLHGSGETDGHVASDLLQGEAVEHVREEAPADADIAWPRVGFEVTAERNQCIDWLHRGYREPLASMGIYVYCMYVYTAHADPGTYDPQDFYVYRFADTHPGAGQRVQKLRVNEMFKVPRLFGFTMPRQDSEPEKNALFKSVLFKPVFAEVHDQVEAFRTLVDERGYFQGPWEQWFKLQRIMADRFYKLQDAAGKLFTLADIDVDALQMQDPCSHGRVRPSAAEFVAKIVVEVVTNMDMDAEAKSRPRQPTRPDAKDYDRDEVNDVDVGLRRDAEGAVLEPGLPSGPGPAVEPDDLQKEELLKRTQAPHPVPDGDLLKVAFAAEYGATSATCDFKKEFDKTFGRALCPCPPEGQAYFSDEVQPCVDYTGMELGLESFQDFRAKQDALFDYKKGAGPVSEESERSPATVIQAVIQPKERFIFLKV